MTAGCSKFLRMKEYVYFGRLLLRTFLQTAFIYVVEGEEL